MFEPFEPLLQQANLLRAAVGLEAALHEAAHLLAIDALLERRLREELDIIDVRGVEVEGGDEGGEDAKAARLGGCCVRFPVVSAELLRIAARNPAHIVTTFVAERSGQRVILVRADDLRFNYVASLGRAIDQVKGFVRHLLLVLGLRCSPPLSAVRA